MEQTARYLVDFALGTSIGSLTASSIICWKLKQKPMATVAAIFAAIALAAAIMNNIYL